MKLDTYRTTLIEKHNIDVTLLYGARENKYESTSSRADGFTSLLLGYNSLEQGENLNLNSSAWEESFLYQMARLNYNYMNKYYLTATYRRDGYSGFSKNNKIGEFPSFALGWSIAEERFMNNFSFIDQLKLRAGYGQSGNLTNRRSSLGLVNSGPEYVLGSSTLIGQTPSSLANNNLLWEKTLEYNYGIDFSILNGLVGGTLDYYTGKTKDLLFSVAVPSVTGFTQIQSNIGEIANSGFEAMINIRPLRNNDFSWDIGLVFSTNKNEVVELPGEDNNGNGKIDINSGSRGSSFLEEGLSIGAIQNFEWDGFWQISDFNEGKITNAQIGSEKVIDQDGVEGFNQEDVIIVGKTEPAYRFGIQNSLQYKQFGLSFFINSIQGGKDGYLGNNTVNYITMGHALSENLYQQLDFWTPQNTSPDWRSPSSTQVVSEFAQFNSRSFIRLQDISLTYDFSSGIINKLGLGDLQVFVSGRNLLTITDWSGWDPETGAGMQGGRPVMKSFTFGLDVSF